MSLVHFTERLCRDFLLQSQKQAGTLKIMLPTNDMMMKASHPGVFKPCRWMSQAKKNISAKASTMNTNETGFVIAATTRSQRVMDR